MKILFVFGGKQKGGAERVITNLSNYMIKDNEVCFLGLKKMDDFYVYNDKIKYYLMEEEKKYKSNFILRNISRVKRINRLVKKINPDVIISFAREQSYRLLFSNFFNKRKIIISVRNDPKQEYKTFFEKTVMKILYSRVDGIVFQTDEAKSFFSKKLQNKSVIIPNPINENFITEPYVGIRKKRIVTAGRLVEQKNQELLIESFSKIANQIPEYNLLIYGEGELRKNLQEKIEKLNLTKRILLMGNVTDLKNQIYDSSLFVLPSTYEGMPNALIEAMSLGLPCISTDCPCGGPRFLIRNGQNGILVPMDDPEEMASEILKLINDEKKRDKLGKNANKISKILDPKIVSAQWINYINQVLGNSDGGH